MLLYFVYTMVQKVKNDQKLKSKGSCLKIVSIEIYYEEASLQPSVRVSFINKDIHIVSCLAGRCVPQAPLKNMYFKRSALIFHTLHTADKISCPSRTSLQRAFITFNLSSFSASARPHLSDGRGNVHTEKSLGIEAGLEVCPTTCLLRQEVFRNC